MHFRYTNPKCDTILDNISCQINIMTTPNPQIQIRAPPLTSTNPLLRLKQLPRKNMDSLFLVQIYAPASQGLKKGKAYSTRK